MEAPEVRYAESSGLAIAYQVLGDGPVDLLYVPGWISHLDLYWEEPTVVRFLRRLGSGFRLILFDRRGTGLSDRVPENELPTLEGRMDDMRAVLDAARSTSAVVFAQGYGTPLAILFAATYPGRVRSLILYSAIAKAGLRTDDYPWGSTEEEARAWTERSRQGGGRASSQAFSCAGSPRAPTATRSKSTGTPGSCARRRRRPLSSGSRR